MELRGKVVLITGASRGIGRALALALAERGCRLLLTALERDELEAVADHLRSSDRANVTVRAADLVDDAARSALVDWVHAQPEPPDILVNNAGGGHFGRFEEASPEVVWHTLNLNSCAPTRLTADLLPLLRQRPQAKIVFISSAIARLPYPGLAVYGAAKGYLSSFTESLACELAGSRVTVLCFHPGLTATEFMTSAGMDMRRIPGFAISTPERVAARIVRAIERDATWVYSDSLTRLGVAVARMLPSGLRVRLFRNLFWSLP